MGRLPLGRLEAQVMPFPDNAALRGLIEKQWGVCRQFGASIGFHSGSGKSAENYQVMREAIFVSCVL